jgi:hypothetical protein
MTDRYRLSKRYMRERIRTSRLEMHVYALHCKYCIDRTDSEHMFGDMVDTFKVVSPLIDSRVNDAFQEIYYYVSTS